MSASSKTESVIGVVIPPPCSESANEQHAALEDQVFNSFANALTGNTNGTGPSYLNSSNTSFEWYIDNKYYTAEVHVRLLRSTEDPASVAPGLSAFVVLGSRVNEHTLGTLESVWMQHVNAADAEIRLITEYSGENSEDDNARKSATPDDSSILSWCLEHDFEYIENTASDDIDAEAPLNADKGYGIGRVREALQAHMWPGLKMKGKPSQSEDTAHSSTTSSAASAQGDSDCAGDKTCTHATDNLTLAALDADVTGNAESSDMSKGFDLQSLLQNMDVLSRAPNDDDEDALEADDSAFATLLGQMRAMKEQASVLPDSQRKDYAERVALKFWEAIGGDANENPLADLQ
eukprot:m.607131 g.607131  ORF g.607131 m.607131 type:complete len:348 (+) comp22477_c0_seq3:194-1237(+)